MSKELYHRALQVHMLNADPTGPKPREAKVGRAIMLGIVLIATSMLLLHLLRGLM